ncbi:MAG: hypothetical protein RLY93_13235 [Sumerlaeia bacterium]
MISKTYKSLAFAAVLLACSLAFGKALGCELDQLIPDVRHSFDNNRPLALRPAAETCPDVLAEAILVVLETDGYSTHSSYFAARTISEFRLHKQPMAMDAMQEANRRPSIQGDVSLAVLNNLYQSPFNGGLQSIEDALAKFGSYEPSAHELNAFTSLVLRVNPLHGEARLFLMTKYAEDSALKNVPALLVRSNGFSSYWQYLQDISNGSPLHLDAEYLDVLQQHLLPAYNSAFVIDTSGLFSVPSSELAIIQEAALILLDCEDKSVVRATVGVAPLLAVKTYGGQDFKAYDDEYSLAVITKIDQLVLQGVVSTEEAEEALSLIH